MKKLKTIEILYDFYELNHEIPAKKTSLSDSDSSNSSNSQILASVHQRSLPEPSTPLPNLRQSIGGRTLYTLCYSLKLGLLSLTFKVLDH